eukprot:COSAG05_NODE_1264_length_5336_cov_17.508497_1_plen_172_part_00
MCMADLTLHCICRVGKWVLAWGYGRGHNGMYWGWRFSNQVMEVVVRPHPIYRPPAYMWWPSVWTYQSETEIENTSVGFRLPVPIPVVEFRLPRPHWPHTSRPHRTRPRACLTACTPPPHRLAPSPPVAPARMLMLRMHHLTAHLTACEHLDPRSHLTIKVAVIFTALYYWM